ncbi:helix-turn-helix transcriptional regulator [Actinomadura syzygii]|uniref:helix-turn-helix transcriptional regulator n=1 Tax=Actinomadura syzygii TaxID=1427538 RepID=UPI001CA35B07|nr:helix-turn-helix transcriptional regulator [Actinomadura syzygii]
MHEPIGEAIRLRRRARGLTQAGLAERAGLTQPAISLLESGSRVPSLPALERVADVLGLRVTVAVEPADPPGPLSRGGG